MATIVCLNKQAPHGPIQGTEIHSKEAEMKGEDGEQTTQNNHLPLSLSSSHSHSLSLDIYISEKREEVAMNSTRISLH